MDNLTDVEDVVLIWLKGWLTDGWKPYTDRPKSGVNNPMPKKYVLIDRTGGPREAMVLDRAEILIEVYNKDDKRAAKELAQLIADKIPELEVVHNVEHSAVNSVVRLDDTLTQFYRYQIYCDVNYRR